jgi:hypothetical protein
MSCPTRSVLRKLGKDIKVYKSCSVILGSGRASNRKAAVISMDGRYPGHSLGRPNQVRSQVSARLRSTDRSFDSQCALARHAAAGSRLAPDGGNTVPDRVVGKPVDWFVFAPRQQPAPAHQEQPDPRRGVARKKVSAAPIQRHLRKPYGERVLSRCFWPVTFKKGGLKFWLRFIEKFGAPGSSQALSECSKTDVDELAEKLERAITDAVFVIPEDSSAQIVEAAGKSGSRLCTAT